MLRIALATLLTALGIATTVNAEDMQVFSVGTGDIDGEYYSTAKALCHPINLSGDHKLRCSPEPTSGSIYNLTMLAKGELDFAFAQSDWQLAAYEGTGPFAGHAMSNLRSVMSLYPETITVLAGRDSGIFGSKDLPGKRIDIGPPASGRHATAMAILRRSGVEDSAYGTFAELTQEQAVDGLCDGSIDATLFVIGHPSALVADALARCGARIIAPSGPGFTRAFARSTDFVASTIPAGTYSELKQDVESYAVYATIVTRADVPFRLVSEMVSNTVANLGQLSTDLPQLRDLTVQDMQTKGLSAPMHSAAELVFEKAGSGASGG